MNTKERVKELASHRGLTLAELERKLSISNGTIGRWTDGRKPNTEPLEKVANYFEVSVDYLLGRTDRKDPWPASTPEEDFGDVVDEKDLRDMVENAQTFDGHQLDQHDKDAIVAFLIGRMSGK